MSGFFETVAARAHGETPAIRPRLPSRFESAGVGAEPIELSIETTAEPGAAPEPGAPPPAESRPDSPPTIPARPETTSLTAAPQAPSVETAEAPVGPVIADPPARRVTKAAPETHAFVEPPPSVTQRSETPAPTAAPTPVRSAEATPQHSARAAPPRDPPVEPKPVTTSPAILEQVLPVPTIRPAPAEPAPPAPRTRAERRAATLAAPREETTVHVSIGRIEIRAVQPAPEARRREPPRSPVMSLEDYLQSRRGRQ